MLICLKSEAAVLISVQDEVKKQGWSKEVCELMFTVISSTNGESVSCIITESEIFQDERLQKLRASTKFHTHLRIFKSQKNKITIDTHQWIQDDSTDFSTSTFTIDKNDLNEQKQSLALFSRNWAVYRMTRYFFKIDILASALPESKEIKLNRKGEMVDAHTLNPLTYRKAYELYSNENERQKNYLKTSLQVAAVLGFGTYLYYKNLASMKRDHDYNSVWNGLSKKASGQAIREDDNDSAANVGHVFAGEIYFLLARNNGLSFIEASLATMASAAAWEFLEYKEVFSINDQILTGWTGAVLGEVMYQMSRAIKNKSTSFVGRTLAAMFDPVSALNNQLTSLSGHRPKDVKYGSLDTAQWAQFEFSFLVGRTVVGNSAAIDYKGIEMKGLVINIPDWDKPGSERKLLLETPISEFQLTYTKSQFGIEDFKLITQAVLAGVHSKNRNERDGYEYLIGLSSGFEWDQKRSAPFAFEDTNRKDKDMWARAHIIGTTIKAIGLYKGIKFSLEMKVHADYVLVSSYALEQLELAEGKREGLLSVVNKRGYYYGTGWNQQLKAAIDYNSWQVGWTIANDNVQNSNYQHRFDDKVTKNYTYEDQRRENKIFIRKALTDSLIIEVSVTKISRAGQIAQLYAKETTEKRTEAKLNYIW